eukprot:2391367-Rhodomonas_salina.1
MSGTDLAYAATPCLVLTSRVLLRHVCTDLAYAAMRAMPCLVLTVCCYAYVCCYAVPGTDIVYAATRPRARTSRNQYQLVAAPAIVLRISCCFRY